MNKLATAVFLTLPIAAPAADEGERQAFPGFSLVPPSGEAWTLASRTQASVLWVRETGDPDSSFAFAVVAGQAPASVRTQGELVAFLERLGSAPPPSPNLELISSTAGPVEASAEACARHDAEIRDNGTGTLLAVSGITCLHPDYPGRMFDVQYTRRAREGEMNEADALEGEALLDSFRFEEAPPDDNWSLSGEDKPPHPGG